VPLARKKKPLPYLVVVKDAEAVKTIDAYMVPDGAHPVSILLDGTCPRCGHHTEWPHPLFAVPGVTTVTPDDAKAVAETLGIDLSSGSEDVHARCDCHEDHPTKPDGDDGCGARFTLHVDWP
jgi:hypothetical protein